MIDDLVVPRAFTVRDAKPRAQEIPGALRSALRLAIPVVGQQFFMRHSRGSKSEKLLFTGLLTIGHGVLYGSTALAAYEMCQRMAYYH